jgi:hypothetical protein
LSSTQFGSTPYATVPVTVTVPLALPPGVGFTGRLGIGSAGSLGSEGLGGAGPPDSVGLGCADGVLTVPPADGSGDGPLSPA